MTLSNREIDLRAAENADDQQITRFQQDLWLDLGLKNFSESMRS